MQMKQRPFQLLISSIQPFCCNHTLKSKHRTKQSKPWLYLIVVVHRFHSGLTHPLHHQSVAEGDSEDRQQVGSNKLVQDESPLMCFRGKPLHAILPGTVPVTLLYTLVH